MGIDTKKLVYDFRRKYNSVNTGRSQDISLVDIIAYLNEAQEIWYENRVSVLQKDQEARNDLRVFKVPGVELEHLNIRSGVCLALFPEDLYYRLNHLVYASKDCCPNITKKIVPRIVTSDARNDAERTPWRKADFFFEQLSAEEDSKGLLIHHQNEMVIDKVVIDYYRKPKELHAPSLEECDGDNYYDYCGRVITEDTLFEVDATFSAKKVVDIAVLQASRDVGDVQGFQSKLSLILGSQQLHK